MIGVNVARQAATAVTLINGAPAETISVHDRGFQFGDGLFETLAVSQGKPLLWERHIARLFLGAERLGLAAPAERLLRDEAGQLCQQVERGVLKIIVTRGISQRGYAAPAEALPTRVVSLSAWPDYPARHQDQGVAVQFCRTTLARQRDLAGIKHLNRLEQVLARAELREDCAEGLLLDEQGNVIEATMSNIFVVARGNLLTPELSHSGVAGVMRGLVLERAAALSIDCRVLSLKRQDILDADELFLTNSLIGLWPVCRIESRHYPQGRITQQIQQAIRDAHGTD